MQIFKYSNKATRTILSSCAEGERQMHYMVIFKEKRVKLWKTSLFQFNISFTHRIKQSLQTYLASAIKEIKVYQNITHEGVQ